MSSKIRMTSVTAASLPCSPPRKEQTWYRAAPAKSSTRQEQLLLGSLLQTSGPQLTVLRAFYRVLDYNATPRGDSLEGEGSSAIGNCLPCLDVTSKSTYWNLVSVITVLGYHLAYIWNELKPQNRVHTCECFLLNLK